MKQRIIEEKLEKLGVERGTGPGTGSGMSSSTVPHIHAPHARAASVRLIKPHGYHVFSL